MEYPSPAAGAGPEFRCRRLGFVRALRLGRRLGALGLVMIFFSASAWGQVTNPVPALTLGWDASVDPTVTGYFVYFGSAPGVYTNKTDAGTNTSLTLSDIAAGSTYYFTATAYNAAGMESSFAPEVSSTVSEDPVFSNLTASQSTIYGSTTITLAGTVGAPGLDPAVGEPVVVTINGNTQAAAIYDSTGDFSLTFNPGVSPVIPASGTPYTITYSYGGDAVLNSASDASTLLTVNPAVVTISSGLVANDRPYDGTTTASIVANAVVLTGVVPSDTANVALSTNGYLAAFATAVPGNAVPVTVAGMSLTGSAAPNYVLVQPVILTASISPILAGINLVSSLNPSGFGTPLTFTASIVTNGVVAGDAAGIIQFETNGVPAGAPVNVTAGVVSATFDNLPRETNAVVAVYLGGGNYQGSTSETLFQIVTNHPPVAAAYYILRTPGTDLEISWASVGTNWTDVDGDPLAETAFAAVTTNGVSVLGDDTGILYPGSAPGVNDQITYEISDGFGGTNEGVINVVVNPFPTSQPNASLVVSGGSVTASFSGLPGYTYEILRSTNLLAGAGWVTIATQTADETGLVTVTDDFPDLANEPPDSAFYELEWHP